ncbi:hypothetical protein [Methanosphaera sp. WGK6]|uniref:hypothetical protein n=1 Tax=Methanosphaera sp. WGK6 TaxID=1561964 RepID=UPI00084CADF0|nr:hypothetical protein [Methanosphaera sp. WGK6]OED29925.1 hypothetical protein NL43_05825 [Methanosphaera sp. WGK6]
MAFFENQKQKPQNNEIDKWITIKNKQWNPKVGDTIEGILIDKTLGLGKYKQSIYLIKQENEIIEVWGRTQLDRLMIQVDIKDYIRITYQGKLKTRNNNNINQYKVEKRSN